MGTYYSEKETLSAFFQYWQKIYPALDDFHKDWLIENGEIIQMTRGQIISEAPHMQSTLYIVLAGMLAKERYCPDRDEQLIMTVALPHMGFFTTMHFFSKSSALGDIVCLRPGLVLKIPYKVIARYRNQEKAIDTLIDLLVNKKKYQLDHLRVMDSIPNIMERYFFFSDHLPLLQASLRLKEQARLLHISESSVHRARRLYARRKNKR